MPKVSVIVPVYNVEKYLERCLDSLIRQTLTDIEIILVNDGSTDGSAKICKRYAKEHHNIKCVSQKNRGLSAARNVGIEIATGEFLGFVDSDDFVKEDMFEFLYDNAIEHDAGVVACGHETYYEDGSTKINTRQGIKKFYEHDEAMDYFLLQEYFDVITCNKIYLRSLFNKIKFPLGKLYEDILTIYRLIDLAGGIYFDSEPKYFYFKRNDSISQTAFKPETAKISEYVDDYVSKYRKIITRPKYMYLGQIRWNLVVVNKILAAGMQDETLVRKVKKLIDAHLTLVMFTDKIGVVRKIQILLFRFSTKVYRRIYLNNVIRKRVGSE